MAVPDLGCLREAIFTTRSNVPTSLQKTLASSMPKQIFDVINKNGGATHFWVFFDTFSSVFFCCMALNIWSVDEQPVWGEKKVFNKLPTLYFLSFVPVSSFCILNSYLPGYNPPVQNANTCNFPPVLRFSSGVYSFFLAAIVLFRQQKVQ